ncbi:MAG: heme exporter protein B [Cycloclasticus sp.]|jgi:heme exporter protein B|tara:strand:- start:4012 stop:4686 length:675 start_codon:yes stop_codon:yes gene_type:complete
MPELSFFILLQREFTIASRCTQQFLLPVFFFCLVVLLFPLGLSPSPELIQTIAPGIIWVATLLAVLFSLDNLFLEDFEDGFIELLIFSPCSLPVLLAGKVSGLWLIIIAPLLAISALLSVFLGLPVESLSTLMISLLLGTPILMFVGAIAAALTTGTQQNSMLSTLLILPLYIPVLIFASSAVQNAATGLSASPQLYMLSALLVLTLTLAPVAISSALKIGLSQ